jgi:predicted dehydrogenase
MVAHTLRWEPIYEAATRLARELGSVREARVSFARGELAARPSADFLATDHHRALFAIGVHFLDWANVLFPEGFVEASARGPSDLTCSLELRARHGGRFAAEIRVEGSETFETLSVAGERGSLEGDRNAHALRLRDAPVALPARTPTLPRVLESFRDFALGETPNPVPLEAGLRAVALAEACVRSVERGAPVSISEETS